MEYPWPQKENHRNRFLFLYQRTGSLLLKDLFAIPSRVLLCLLGHAFCCVLFLWISVGML